MQLGLGENAGGRTTDLLNSIHDFFWQEIYEKRGGGARKRNMAVYLFGGGSFLNRQSEVFILRMKVFLLKSQAHGGLGGGGANVSADESKKGSG